MEKVYCFMSKEGRGRNSSENTVPEWKFLDKFRCVQSRIGGPDHLIILRSVEDPYCYNHADPDRRST